MGCERNLILGSLILAVAVAGTATHWFVIPFISVIWLFNLWALRAMAKADPLLSQVYIRSVRYKKYYPARSTEFAPTFQADSWKYGD